MKRLEGDVGCRATEEEEAEEEENIRGFGILS